MKERDLRYGRTYRYRFPQYFFISFIFMFTLAGFIVIYNSVSNKSNLLWLAIVSFVVIDAVLGLGLAYYRIRRIETFKDRIVIYGRKSENIKFFESFTHGYTIKYKDIETIDLYPIKTFGAHLTHQINLKLVDGKLLYINQFSDLDHLCACMRQLLVYYRKHKSEFEPLPIEEPMQEAVVETEEQVTNE